MFGVNLLLCKICLIVLYSMSLSVWFSGYVSILFVKYLTAAVFLFGGGIRILRDDDVCGSRFLVYMEGELLVLENGEVQEINTVIVFVLHGKGEGRGYIVE